MDRSNTDRRKIIYLLNARQSPGDHVPIRVPMKYQMVKRVKVALPSFSMTRRILDSPEKKSPRGAGIGMKKKPGDDLLSRPKAVPSALEGLTSVFGMGTGVSPPR